MKLVELKDELKDRPSQESLIFKKYDGFVPEEADRYVDPFDVKVEYKIYPDEDVYHPYGEGWAKEKLYGGIKIEALLADEPIVVKAEGTDEVVETYPVGTDLTTLPTWDDRDYEIFLQEIEKNES